MTSRAPTFTSLSIVLFCTVTEFVRAQLDYKIQDHNSELYPSVWTLVLGTLLCMQKELNKLI